jgi:hypothetical protein
MKESAQTGDLAIAATTKDPRLTPHTDANTEPMLDLNRDVLASSQRRRYLDSLDDSDLAT